MVKKSFLFEVLSGCIALVLFCSCAVGEVKTESKKLSSFENDAMTWVDGQKKVMLNDLKKYVEINTGTLNREGLDRFRKLLETELKELGFETMTKPGGQVDILTCKGGQMKFADHLVATRKGNGKNRLMLNGHLDTVFSKDDEFQKLKVEADGTLKGPGVVDMKGGLLVMLYALKALHRQGRLDDTSITIVLNTDEEIGSLGSRSLIESTAKNHDIGLVFEGSFKNKLTRVRKGLGQARLKVTGRESHAGGAHDDGVSAVLELAHKTVELEALTDYERKVTINVGTVSGGEKRNTRPGCAEAYVDLRYMTIADGEYLKAEIKKIAERKHTTHLHHHHLPKTESWAVLHRPAKEAHAGTDEMISKALSLASLIGSPLDGTRTSGGGTDGSLMQAVGLPNVDSLGPDGIGFHSSREETSLQSLVDRTKLATLLINRLIHQSAKK